MLAALPAYSDNYSNKHPANRHYLKIIAAVMPFVLTIAGVCYLYIGLGDGQPFDEDYAVYLQQAWNIAHNVAITEMGIVQYSDPDIALSHQSPLTYPPLLPIIYAFPVLVHGFEFEILKTFQVGMLLSGLFMFCHAMQIWRFDALEISASAVIFALSDQIRWSVNSIGADLPFIFFLMFALMAVHRFVEATGSQRLRWAIFSGIAIFLAVDLRTVAVALVPTLLAADALRHGRFDFFSLAIPIAIAAALWLGQSQLGLSGASYGYVLNFRFFMPVENVHQFYWALASPLTASPFPKLAIGILLFLAAMAALGLLYEAANGMVIAVFIVSYTVLLLVLPNFSAGARYLVPHLLVLGAFAVRGAAVVGRLVNSGIPARRAFAWGTAALGVVGGFLVPSPFPSGHWNFGVASDPAREVFTFIREQSPADALVAASKHRSFHLFTQRTTIRLPTFRTSPEMLEWLHVHGVTEVVLKYSPPRWNNDLTDCPEQPLCHGVGPEFKEIFRDSDFALYQVASGSD